MAIRQIINIDEALCNGCGQCILDCAEGALEIRDEKAKVVSEILCDGLGACLSGCPQGALQLVTREAPEFDEQAVHEKMQQSTCPGSRAVLFEDASSKTLCHSEEQKELQGKHWPLKLRLVPIHAPFLKGARITIAADCTAPASKTFYDMIQGRRTLIACPKFEDKNAILEKLIHLIQESAPHDMEVLRMEVPCCAPLAALCKEAAARCGTVPVKERILQRNGEERKQCIRLCQ